VAIASTDYSVRPPHHSSNFVGPLDQLRYRGSRFAIVSIQPGASRKCPVASGILQYYGQPCTSRHHCVNYLVWERKPIIGCGGND
jgi:hypothetical protein